ncbi:MAG: hypothetical protein ACI378_04565, partial [Bacteroides sp.]
LLLRCLILFLFYSVADLRYMMKKSRQWEEWRKRMAGANGYGGETIIVYTDYLLFLATSYV